MNHQNLLLQDDPFAAPDTLEHLPSHHCAADAPDIKARLRNPMGMSQFANRDALYRELNDQRNDAADHIKSLESENDSIRAALADKVSAATMLTDISIKEGGVNMSLEGGACHLLAESFADQFREHGGANYLEVRFSSRDGLKLLVTLQNLDGKSPGQLKSEAEQALAEGVARIAGLEMRLAGASKGNAMYEHVRTLLPCDYVQICVNAAAGMGAFDDLVLADMDKRQKERA